MYTTIKKAIEKCGYVGVRDRYVDISTYNMSNPYAKEMKDRKNEIEHEDILSASGCSYYKTMIEF